MVAPRGYTYKIIQFNATTYIYCIPATSLSLQQTKLKFRILWGVFYWLLKRQMKFFLPVLLAAGWTSRIFCGVNCRIRGYLCSCGWEEEEEEEPSPLLIIRLRLPPPTTTQPPTTLIILNISGCKAPTTRFNKVFHKCRDLMYYCYGWEEENVGWVWLSQ
jgi:hypothetical protein